MAKGLLGDALNGTQFMGSGNTPLAGGKVYTYEPGTTTPMATYKEESLTNAHTNPIILDANGRPPSYVVWLSDQTKIVVYDSDDVLQYDNPEANPDLGISGGGSWALKEANVVTKTSNYTVTAGDDGKLILCNSVSDITISLPAAATAADGFVVTVMAISLGDVIIDPDGGEQVNSSSTATIRPLNGMMLRCNGTAWRGLYNEWTTFRLACEGINGGVAAVATGADSIALQGTASGQNSMALGVSSTASGGGAIALGYSAEADQEGEFAFVSSNQNGKRSEYVIQRATSDATPTRLTHNGGSSSRITVPASTAWGFWAIIAAHEPATGDCAIFEVSGGIKRDGSNNTSLIGSVTLRTLAADAGAAAWSATAVADDSDESLNIQVTGEAAHTINWIGDLVIVEYQP